MGVSSGSPDDRSLLRSHKLQTKINKSMDTVNAIFFQEVWLELLIQSVAKTYSNDHSLMTLYVTVA